MSRGYWSVLVLTLLFTACGVHKVTVSSGAGWIGKDVKKLGEFKGHQWGFALYDPEDERWIYRRNADQYFTPASNTKILTLYTSLKHLGDSTIALRYAEQADTLYFWGTGDPSAMYTVPDSNAVIEFIKDHPASTIYYAPLDPVAKFRPGWAWDDYSHSFQVERSTLPLYGNRLTFSKLALQFDGTVTPGYFKDFVVEDPALPTFAARLPEANAFSINSSLIDEVPFKRTIPFVVSEYDVVGILSDLTKRKIELDYNFNHPDHNNTVTGTSTDTLFQRMMWDSDNFIAEQLMIQVADKLALDLSIDSVIQLMLQSDFVDVPQDLQWYDGSGLSRYNLFTPESLVWILEKLYDEYGFNYLKEIFPAGGESGTIEDLYGIPGEPPFVYAKTGTLRNRHCLSGFIITRSSKVLIFSFMHSNFIGSPRAVKRDMQELLMAIREKY